MPTEAKPISATPATALPASAEALLAESGQVAGIIRLSAGMEINEKFAGQMASERPVRLIVLAGAADCGKTTLLTSLYEMFQEGPIDKKQFAGCETLPHLKRNVTMAEATRATNRKILSAIFTKASMRNIFT